MDIIDQLRFPLREEGEEPPDDPNVLRLVAGFCYHQCLWAADEIERLRGLVHAATETLEPQRQAFLRAKALEHPPCKFQEEEEAVN